MSPTGKNTNGITKIKDFHPFPSLFFSVLSLRKESGDYWTYGKYAELLREANNAGVAVLLTIYANIIVFRRRTILKLFAKLDEDEYHKNIEYAQVKTYIEVLSRLYFYPIQIGLVFWFIDRAAWNSRCLSWKKMENDSKITCSNSFSDWMPSNMDFPLLDWCILFSCTYALYYMPYVVTISSLHIGCTCVAVARLQRLMVILEQINLKRRIVSESRRNLLHCFEFFEETERITKLISIYVNEKLNPVLSFSVMVMVALLTNQIITSFDGVLFLELGVWILGPALISLHAQDLEDMSEKLNHCVYGLPWYQMHHFLIKDFHLFLARTQKPFRLSVPMNIHINKIYLHKFMKFTYTTFMYLSRMKKG